MSATVHGQFFLCMPASRCTTRDGQHGVLLKLREPAPASLFPDGLVAVWLGSDAQAFLQLHEQELRPGRGVHLQLNHITARDGQVRSRVGACELLPLPPSWRKQAAAQPSASA